jgi:hypothetical protein
VSSLDHDWDDSWHDALPEDSTPDWYDDAYLSIYGAPPDAPADFL